MRRTSPTIVSNSQQSEQIAGTPGPGAGPRLASPLSTEPHAWWERQCLVCGRSFGRNVAVCPTDATALKRVEVSLPFLWIG